MIGTFSQTSIRSVKLKLRRRGQCGYSVSVVIEVYYLGSRAEAAERATPSGVLLELVLEPTATTLERVRMAAWVSRAAALRAPLPVAPLGTWAVVRLKAAKGNDELGWATAGECRDP
jgi:uncharacterized membrane protein